MPDKPTSCLKKEETHIIKHIIIIILAVLSLLWVLSSLLLYFYQNNLVFRPNSNIEKTPKDIDLYYEDVILTTDDNIKINGWWIPHKKPKATLLFFHGNAGNISNRLEYIQLFNEIGLSVFIVDYHGYGKSNGVPSEANTYLDAKSAWEYLTKYKKICDDNIIIYGHSLGGAIAAWLAHKYQAMALIIESSFTSIIDMGKYNYPYIPIKTITNIKYPTKKFISKVYVPVLILHSKEDEVIPYKFGKQIFEAANIPKVFVDIEGNHNNGFFKDRNKYIKIFDSFISELSN